MSVPLATDLLGPLLDGAERTIQLTLLGMVLAGVVALGVGVARLSKLRRVKWVAVVYIEVFRGTSVIVQMFWFFFVLPTLGIDLTPMAAAVLALGLNTGAYGAELVRGAVLGISKGQVEAAIALNMRPWLRLRRVVLPQALIALLPPYGNLMIELLKGTSLASLVTINELTFEGQILRASHPTETLAIFGIVLLMYFLMSSCITAIVRLIERRVSRDMDVGHHAGGHA